MIPRVQRRLYKRIRCSLRGEIVDAGSRASKCDIADISPRGALLGVTPDTGVPNEFVLSILGTGIKQPVKLMWRAGNKAGVRFIGSASAEIKAAISRGAANKVLTANDLIPLKSLPPSNQTSQLRSMASGPASSSARRLQASSQGKHPVVFIFLVIFVAFAGGAIFWAVSNWGPAAQPGETQAQVSSSEAISPDDPNLVSRDARHDRLAPVIHSIGHIGSTILGPILQAIGKHSPAPVSEENEFPVPHSKQPNNAQNANSPQSGSQAQSRSVSPAADAASSGPPETSEDEHGSTVPSWQPSPPTPYHPIAAETSSDNFISVSRSASLVRNTTIPIEAEGSETPSFPTLDQLDEAKLLFVAHCLNSLAQPRGAHGGPAQFILIDRCLPRFAQDPTGPSLSALPSSFSGTSQPLHMAARGAFRSADPVDPDEGIGFRGIDRVN